MIDAARRIEPDHRVANTRRLGFLLRLVGLREGESGNCREQQCQRYNEGEDDFSHLASSRTHITKVLRELYGGNVSATSVLKSDIRDIHEPFCVIIHLGTMSLQN